MLWYAFMINNDRKEKFDAELNMTEYLASFSNYEAVRQTRDGRENQKVVSDADFEKQIREQFGRDLTPQALESGSRAEVLPEDNTTQEVKRKGDISIDDIRRYTGIKLDDIRFIPNKK